MKVLTVRNVQEALPLALQLLEREGRPRDSRNGPVLIAPWPVTTVYTHPWERVIFHEQRDANPFFHLYEALWMLAGRNDVAPLERYVKRSIDYSDDGKTLWGAYGYRWRKAFNLLNSTGYIDGFFQHDQLEVIANDLIKNPDSRRNVLQMWNTENDLGNPGKDVPCNTMATFQRGLEGELNLTVFCRSNDIVWGCYGANAVQFSMLLEYMASWINCPIGAYSQISVNWHGYLKTLETVKEIRPDKMGYVHDPYRLGFVRSIPMASGYVQELNQEIDYILKHADAGTMSLFTFNMSRWGHNMWLVLEAHEVYRNTVVDKYTSALEVLSRADQTCDWVAAAQQWIARRQYRANSKQV